MDTVNLQSLSLVRDELVATIEEAAKNLEEFVTKGQDSAVSLQKAIECISQISGTLKLIEFKGAELLSQELLATSNEISPGSSGSKYDRRLDVVSSTFFVLTRYMEFVQQTERRVPVLLIPQINELRKLRDEPTLPECHFFDVDLSHKPKLPEFEPYDLSGQKVSSMVRRLRQMYQIGLMGLIKERQVKNSVAMMRRALKRFQRISGRDKPLTLLWWMADVTLEALVSQKMQMVETRKILFGRIDRIIRQVEKNGEAAFEAQPPNGIIKELVYLLALSNAENDDIKLVRQSYNLERFPYTDHELAGERDLLNGPSAHTVSSLANVLQTELSNSKKVLENASQSSTQKIDDMDGFLSTLQKIAEILAIIGLVSASSTLKEEIKRIERWKAVDSIESDEMNEVANTFLYIESAVASIELTKLSEEKLDMANRVAQEEVIASGALAEAKKIVLEECEAGITLTKRALSAFSDSEFDNGHIRNIAKTLNSVRGGMLMLKCDRAANILQRCCQFVEEALMDPNIPPALKEMLETFADSIISIEYYLNSATASLHMDESVLKLAEESLEALGYPVESVEDRA